MATEEDLKKAEGEGSEEPSPSDAMVRASAESPGKEPQAKPEADDADEEEDSAAPMQLGYKRYVYAAYMAGALLVAFLTAKITHVAWYRLGQWKPELGEPQDELIYPLAAIVGALVAFYYWRKPSARQYANEVAEELSKVTWPSRKEVTNSTTVVVLTTLFATVFFALMDRFWSFVTDKIYTF